MTHSFMPLQYTLASDYTNMAKTVNCPIPDAQEIVRSQALMNTFFEDRKSCSFSEYMAAALYDARYGYYNKSTQVLGRQGDFMTAPTLSPILSYCLVNQIIAARQSLGKDYALIELGAGDGTLAMQLLTQLDSHDYLPTHYYIVETAQARIEEQRARLHAQAKKLGIEIHWLNTIDALPTNLTAFVIGNEVLDAYPCEVLHFENAWQQAKVSLEGEKLNIFFEPASKGLLDKINHTLPSGCKFFSGYQTEIRFQYAAMMTSLSKVLKRGYVVWIDYGYVAREYYHPDRHMGTLSCYYQHHNHDQPLFLPGGQDITAHVDFSAVWQAGRDAGFDLAGFTTQSRFILQSDVTTLLAQVNDPTLHQQLAMQLKQLILPGQMGEAFKIMALAIGKLQALPAFLRGDLRHQL